MLAEANEDRLGDRIFSEHCSIHCTTFLHHLKREEEWHSVLRTMKESINCIQEGFISAFTVLVNNDKPLAVVI